MARVTGRLKSHAVTTDLGQTNRQADGTRTNHARITILKRAMPFVLGYIHYPQAKPKPP